VANAVWVQRQAFARWKFFASWALPPASVVRVLIHINEQLTIISDWPDPQLLTVPFSFVHLWQLRLPGY